MPPQAAPPWGPPPASKSKKGLIAILVGAGVILVAAIVVLIIALSGDKDNETSDKGGGTDKKGAGTAEAYCAIVQEQIDSLVNQPAADTENPSPGSLNFDSDDALKYMDRLLDAAPADAKEPIRIVRDFYKEHRKEFEEYFEFWSDSLSDMPDMPDWQDSDAMEKYEEEYAEWLEKSEEMVLPTSPEYEEASKQLAANTERYCGDLTKEKTG
jgi:hypothetical protein